MKRSLKQVTSVELESEKSRRIFPNCLFISILSQVLEVQVALTFYFPIIHFYIMFPFACIWRNLSVYAGNCFLEKCLLS